jgi:UDP-glucose 4-epimerase
LQDGTGEAGIVAITSMRILNNEQPVIYGDGMKSRDFVYVKDVARANMMALESTLTGVCNIATGQSTSIRQVIDALIDCSNWEGGIEFKDDRTGEVAQSVLDVHRAEMDLHWKSKIPLQTGLQETFESFRASDRQKSDILDDAPTTVFRN